MRPVSCPSRCSISASICFITIILCCCQGACWPSVLGSQDGWARACETATTTWVLFLSFAHWLHVFCKNISVQKTCGGIWYGYSTFVSKSKKSLMCPTCGQKENKETRGQGTLTESCLMNHVAKLCNETKITAARLSLPLRMPRWLWKVIRRPLRQSQVLSWCVSNKSLWRILMKTNKGISRICTYSTLYIQDFFSCAGVPGSVVKKNQSLLNGGRWRNWFNECGLMSCGRM